MIKANTFDELTLSAHALRLCIVRARFNTEVTHGLLEGALDALEEAGAVRHDVCVAEVPGSYDIPYGVQTACAHARYDAIIALGAIIKGETDHDAHIATAVFGELLRLEQRYELPIALGIITAHSVEQAEARSRNDERNVGRQAALSALEMLSLRDRFGTNR